MTFNFGKLITSQEKEQKRKYRAYTSSCVDSK